MTGHYLPERRTIDRRQRGAEVEAAARRMLVDEGLREIASNANFRSGELDLVMRDGACMVFVEVRYRRHTGYGGGAASVDIGKRRKLVRAAQAFLAAHREFANTPCRFDVVEASGDPGAPELHWLKDAFRGDDI